MARWRRTYPKLPRTVFPESLMATYTCPETKDSVTVDLKKEWISIVGGCRGGHGPDEYCYCDSPEAEVTINCSSCKKQHKMTINN